MVVLSDSYNGLHGVENLRGIRRAGLNFDGSQFARLQSLSEGLIGAERYPSASRSLGDNQVASHCPCRKLKLERIDGAGRPRPAQEARGRVPSPLAVQVRPCSETSACDPHCSISDTTEARAEDAVPQR